MFYTFELVWVSITDKCGGKTEKRKLWEKKYFVNFCEKANKREEKVTREWVFSKEKYEWKKSFVKELVPINHLLKKRRKNEEDEKN